NVEREMPAADFESLCLARNQCQRDAQVFLVAQQVLRVVHPEREADQGRDRRQRDVALVEGELDAQRFLAVDRLLANDAVVGNRRGIRTRVRTGQGEARDLAAIGEARQV